MKKEKRKRGNKASKKEEKNIFLYFCTQSVKEKGGKSKPKKRKSAEKRKSHMPALSSTFRETHSLAPMSSPPWFNPEHPWPAPLGSPPEQGHSPGYPIKSLLKR